MQKHVDQLSAFPSLKQSFVDLSERILEIEFAQAREKETLANEKWVIK